MRKLLVLGLIVLPLLVAGCSKGPAEAALKAADEAIAQVQPEAAKFLPAGLEPLTAAAAEAKAKFDAGDYKAALAVAKNLPVKAADLAKDVAAKKNELMAKWNAVQGTLPALVQGLTERVGALAAMKKLPKGFDAAQLETAKTSLTDTTDLWATATNAFSAGDVVSAVAKAADVQTKADELAKLLETVVLPPAKK
jgi:hypothetical protein